VLLNGSKGVSAWSHEISPGDAPELIAHHADERGYLDRKWVLLPHTRARAHARAH
jgi:hypothetical protein